MARVLAALALRWLVAPRGEPASGFQESSKCFTLAMRGACTDVWLRQKCPYTCGVDVAPAAGAGGGAGADAAAAAADDVSAACEDELLKAEAEATDRDRAPRALSGRRRRG